MQHTALALASGFAVGLVHVEVAVLSMLTLMRLLGQPTVHDDCRRHVLVLHALSGLGTLGHFTCTTL